jgi:hypothetical protein
MLSRLLGIAILQWIERADERAQQLKAAMFT